MSKRKRISIPIEDDSSHNISPSQKKHYTSMGYKPYLARSGKVKWLNDEQQVYEKIKYAHTHHSHAVKKAQRHTYHRRRHNKSIVRFIKKNWLLLLVGLLLILVIIFAPQIVNWAANLKG